MPENGGLSALRSGCPDFNPIERLWLRIKCDWFSDFIAKTGAELEDHLCAELCDFMDDPVNADFNTAFRK